MSRDEWGQDPPQPPACPRCGEVEAVTVEHRGSRIIRHCEGSQSEAITRAVEATAFPTVEDAIEAARIALESAAGDPLKDETP